MTVQITKNPAGRYNLAYEVGEIVTLPDSQGLDMIADGYAILIADTPQTATLKNPIEKR